MKTYMPLNGLRWSRNSGSANCDMPQSAVFGRPGGGNEVHPSYIPILHPDIYCSNWLLVIPATLINSILFAYSNL